MYSFRLTSYAPNQYTVNLLSLDYFHLQSTEMVFDHLFVMLRPIYNQQRALNVEYEAAKPFLLGEAFSVCFHSTL